MDFKNIFENAKNNNNGLTNTSKSPTPSSSEYPLNNENINRPIPNNNNITNSNDLKNENNNNSSLNEENNNSEEKVKINNNSEKHNQQEFNQEVGPGKTIDENGNVVNKNSRKAVEAIGRGAAAYFTGGKSIGKDEMITKSSIGDKTIGQVSDTLEKVHGVNEALEEIGESGLADSVNETLDTIGKAERGDIKGAIESGKVAVKDIKKAKKHYSRKMIYMALTGSAIVLFVCVIIIAICGPYLGGYLDIVNDVETVVDDTLDNMTNYSGTIQNYYDQNYNGTIENPLTPDIAATTQTYIDQIPGFETLSPIRQDILLAAASGVASGRPYHIKQGENDPCNGKPSGQGIEGIKRCGIDCSGFVQWVLWTATGTNQFSGGTCTMITTAVRDGTFEVIDESELKPGDIGMGKNYCPKNGYNHTGVYAGTTSDGKKVWLHAESTQTGLQRNTYKGFTYFLRFKGADN